MPSQTNFWQAQMISSSNATSKQVAAIGSPAELAQSLSKEIAEFEGLHRLLREEQQALQAQDLDRVSSLALEKNDRLGRLGALGAARTRFLDANSKDSTQIYLDAAVRESWLRLLAHAAEARETNIVNGRLIAMQLRYTTGALAVLQQAASHLMCYGADGQAQALGGARTLASA